MWFKVIVSDVRHGKRKVEVAIFSMGRAARGRGILLEYQRSLPSAGKNPWCFIFSLAATRLPPILSSEAPGFPVLQSLLRILPLSFR